MSSQGFGPRASTGQRRSALRTIGSIGLFGLMVVAWLAMAVFALAMLVVMLTGDLFSHLRRALHLGPAPTTPRASYRIASIF